MLPRSRKALSVGALALLLAVALAAAFAAAASTEAAPLATASATCSDYSTQADAQRAADTRDTDGDGRYCVISPQDMHVQAVVSGDGNGS